MTDFRNSTLLRLALVGTLAACLGLAGCGRKGPLDPPPGASIEGVPQANMPGLMSKNTNDPPQNIGGQPTDNPELGPDGRPLMPKGAKKRIPLDALLN